MECPDAVADLAVTNKLRIVRIPVRVTRVLRVALVTFTCYFTHKIKVVSIDVVGNGLDVFVEPYIVPQFIIVRIS
jgi:hypothetical protein